jgi:hypothetical protein
LVQALFAFSAQNALDARTRRTKMSMAQVQPVEMVHRTSDLHLAAVLLATGHRLVTTTRDGTRVQFHFAGPTVDAAVLAYTNETLQVNACRFVHALDRLRTLVAHTRH